MCVVNVVFGVLWMLLCEMIGVCWFWFYFDGCFVCGICGGGWLDVCVCEGIDVCVLCVVCGVSVWCGCGMLGVGGVWDEKKGCVCVFVWWVWVVRLCCWCGGCVWNWMFWCWWWCVMMCGDESGGLEVCVWCECVNEWCVCVCCGWLCLSWCLVVWDVCVVVCVDDVIDGGFDDVRRRCERVRGASRRRGRGDVWMVCEGVLWWRDVWCDIWIVCVGCWCEKYFDFWVRKVGFSVKRRRRRFRFAVRRRGGGIYWLCGCGEWCVWDEEELCEFKEGVVIFVIWDRGVGDVFVMIDDIL